MWGRRRPRELEDQPGRRRCEASKRHCPWRDQDPTAAETPSGEGFQSITSWVLGHK